MASDTIKGAGDIYQKDLYGDLAKSAKEALPLMEKLNQVLKTTTASNLKLVESQIKDVEGLKKVTEGVNNTNKAFNQKLALDKETIKLEQKLKANRTKQAQQNEVTKVQISTETRARKALAKETLNLTGAYTKESAKLNDLRKKYKNLAISEKGVSKEQKILLSQITKLDTKLKKIDKTVGQSQRNVGNYGSAFSRAGGALRSFAGALGITAGITGLFNVMKSTVAIFSSFEKANSNLEAVLGATNEQMILLSANAKLLGSTTAFTASEVVGLQTAFAKLGFPTDDILLMTESTLNAAAAMGSGLDETAALTGSTLKAFGLDASEAGRVNDVLARSTSASALDFGKLNAAMSTIAPVANSFGFSVEGTTALLGQLSNAGFDASSAATATRNVLLNLADSNSKLAKSLKEPVTDLPSLVKGLKQLKGEGIDLAEALQLTDKRSVAAFSTFLNGADDVLELNEALLASGGTAQQMADTQLDNLSGSVTILNSAWEGFILSLEDGNGSFSRVLRNIVDLATEILSLLTGTEKLTSEMSKHEKVVRKYAKSFISIFKAVGSLVAAFITFKVVVSATMAVSKAYTTINNVLRISKIALSGGIGKATKAMKAFNTVSKANVIGLVVVLLAAAVAAWIAFNDGVTEAIRLQKIFDETSAKSAASRKIEIDERRKDQLTAIELEELRVRKLIALGGDEKKLNKDLSEFKNSSLKREQKVNELALENFIKASDIKKALRQEEVDDIDKNIAKAEQSTGSVKTGNSRTLIVQRLNKQRDELVKSNTVFTGAVDGNIKAIQENILRINKEIAQSDVNLIEVIKDGTESTNAEYIKRTKGLELLARRLEDLRNQATKDDLERQQKITNTKFRREIDAIKGNSKVANELRIELAKARDTKLLKLQDDFDAAKKKREDDFNEKRNKRLDSEELREQEEGKNKELLKAQIKFDDQVAEIEKSKLLNDIEKDAAIIQRKKELVAAIAKIEKDAAQELLEIDKQNDNERQKIADENVRKQAEIDAEVLEVQKAILNKLEEAFLAASNKKIEDLDEQFNASKENQNRLRDLAAKGSLDAQQSISVESKKQADLKRAKDKEERKQELVSAGFKIFSSLLDQGKNPQDATLETAALLGALPAIIEAIPTAFEGTESTGTVKNQLDSNGGRLMLLHDNERVMTEKQNNKMGGIGNDEAANIIEKYNMGELFNHNSPDISGNLMSSIKLNGLSELRNEMRQVNESIKAIKMPKTSMEADYVRQILKVKTQTGNKIITEISKLH